jgi:hypothetical protein
VQVEVTSSTANQYRSELISISVSKKLENQEIPVLLEKQE